MRWRGDWAREWYREWFGIAPSSTTIDGYGDGGVATLALELEVGYTVEHRWTTDIIKLRAGREQRTARNVIDHESYSGDVFLLDSRPREVRAQLARFAASGSVFLLGLPHEALALRADTSGTTVPVAAADLALCDWARLGQRAVVAWLDDDGEVTSVDVVVQDVTSNSIVVDVAPSGIYGGWIMPVRHVFLAPQQSFPRYPAEAESWSLDAQGAVPLDFAPDLATFNLGDIDVDFAGAIVTSRIFGPPGNALRFGLFHDAGSPDEGSLFEADGEVTFTFKGGTTTLGDLATALEGSVYEILRGTYNAAAVIEMANQFAPELLTGAGDVGAVGTGATLTTYDGDGTTRPVWHRELNVEGAFADGIHAMTQILDRGGKPYSLSTADQADWFRSVMISGGDRADWQWFKLIMSTLRGNWEKFWLPTWRDDLIYISHAGDSLLIDSEDDFTAWWPAQRQDLRLEQEDGTVSYVRITDAVDNGDGTRTLTLSASLSGSLVSQISWLELCRFENADRFSTTHDQHGFSVSLIARVVP